MKCKLCNKKITEKKCINLNLGGLKKLSKSEYICSEEINPFLNLTIFKNNDIVTSCDLLHNEKKSFGQCDFYFCSITCIKKWFSLKIKNKS